VTFSKFAEKNTSYLFPDPIRSHVSARPRWSNHPKVTSLVAHRLHSASYMIITGFDNSDITYTIVANRNPLPSSPYDNGCPIFIGQDIISFETPHTSSITAAVITESFAKDLEVSNGSFKLEEEEEEEEVDLSSNEAVPPIEQAPVSSTQGSQNIRLVRKREIIYDELSMKSIPTSNLSHGGTANIQPVRLALITAGTDQLITSYEIIMHLVDGIPVDMDAVQTSRMTSFVPDISDMAVIGSPIGLPRSVVIVGVGMEIWHLHEYPIPRP
jgi:hypothetical protein